MGTLIVLAFGVCFGIELFQLTNIPLELARTHPWVHWILGRTFGWHDVACYVVGVGIAAAITARPIARAS